MAFESTLIQPLDPIGRYTAVDNWLDDSGLVHWSFRPFWIIGDLRIMHNWMNSHQALCNRQVDRDQRPLIFHYMQLLQAPTQQPLVLERNGIVVGQFDLVHQLLNSSGVNIHFLFPGETNSEKYWQTGLGQLVKLLTLAIPGVPIYIDIPRNCFALHDLVEQIGVIGN